MKEKICEFVEHLQKNPVIEEICENEFLCGMFAGIGAYIVIVLLVHLVFIIARRRKKCTELLIAAENGTIAVSLKAVTAALKKELASFTQLEISKIVIFQKKYGYIFEVRGRFIPGVSGAPELYAALEHELRENMKNIFGVENIAKVNLRIESCVETESSKPENDGFIDAVM